MFVMMRRDIRTGLPTIPVNPEFSVDQPHAPGLQARSTLKWVWQWRGSTRRTACGHHLAVAIRGRSHAPISNGSGLPVRRPDQKESPDPWHQDRGSRIYLAAIGSASRACRQRRCVLVYGSCSNRTLFGVVLPTFTRIGSRSLLAPVYFTAPSMFTSVRR